MRLVLDPLSPSGVSVAPAPVIVRNNQGNGYIGDAGIPKGGSINQVLQNTGGSSAWGVALTVSNIQPINPAINDLWVDTT